MRTSGLYPFVNLTYCKIKPLNYLICFIAIILLYSSVIFATHVAGNLHPGWYTSLSADQITETEMCDRIWYLITKANEALEGAGTDKRIEFPPPPNVPFTRDENLPDIYYAGGDYDSLQTFLSYCSAIESHIFIVGNISVWENNQYVPKAGLEVDTSQTPKRHIILIDGDYVFNQPYILLHEIGHMAGLTHTTELNLMNPNSQYSTITSTQLTAILNLFNNIK